MAETGRDLRRRAHRPLLLPRLLARRLRHARRAARARRARRDRRSRCRRCSPRTSATSLSGEINSDGRRPGGRDRRARGGVRRPRRRQRRRPRRPHRQPRRLVVQRPRRPTPSRCCGSTPRGATRPRWRSVRDEVLAVIRRDHEPVNLDPTLLDDHRLPGLPRRRSPSTGRGAGLPAAAAWPTRSATTSRCCWSTRPASRPERHRRWQLVRRVPARRRRASWTPPTCGCAALAESGARVRREAERRRRGDRRGGRARRRPARPRAVHRRRPRLPAAARRARAVVPGAVRGLARPGAARLGRQPRPGRRAGPRGLRHRRRLRGRRGRTPRLPGGRRLPARLAGRRARRRPLDHDPAARAPATSWPPPS